MENNKLETEYSSQVYLQLNNVAEFIVKRNVMPEKAVVYSHAFITGKNSLQKDGWNKSEKIFLSSKLFELFHGLLNNLHVGLHLQAERRKAGLDLKYILN